ncbi:MAG: hypothetical protein LC667_03375 [Thioalkalivibrio sp.]|nr:hypothetical protein [Thioalkalivibrio sp.]
MDHGLLQSVGFWTFLFSVDRSLAADVHQGGCSCGARLHRADYLRKPRGGPKGLSREHCYRLSFCCGREGCRKRLTPPSVRFLGRKVYLHAVVILVAAMRQGPTPRRVRELAELFDVDRRTIQRWQVFWREQFPQTPFWKVARGQLALLAELLDLPRALLAAFFRDEEPDPKQKWKELLVFLSPITITGGLKCEVSR